LNGAYTRRTFSASTGLGVEVLVSTPLTMLQWQDAFVGLVPDDSAALAAWDHRTGSPPGRNEVYEGTAGCGVHYLRPEGKHPKLLVMGEGRARKLDVPAALASGRWYTLRIQLLADGSCGVAIDGTPIAVIRSGTPRHGALRALIGGGSRDTRILHGPLEVWRGVKGDVDWRHVTPPCRAIPCGGTDHQSLAQADAGR
jgi:hypothetical protein